MSTCNAVSLRHKKALEAVARKAVHAAPQPLAIPKPPEGTLFVFGANSRDIVDLYKLQWVGLNKDNIFFLTEKGRDALQEARKAGK